MKKLIYCVAALATMIFAGSCQQEIFEPAAKSNTVTYTVEAPADVLTKTIGDGLNVNELIYEVWHTSEETTDLTGAKKLYQASKKMEVVNGVNRTVITLDLLADQHYTILFWAQVEGTYDTENLTAVTYITDKVYNANDESLAAFYSVDFINDGVAKNPTVTLKRPFAQVNLGTLNSKSEEKVNDYKIDLKESRMILDAVPTVFNTATSEATDYKEMTFAYYNVPALGDETTPGKETITVGETDYQYAGMNYVFAGEPVRLTYDIKVSLNGSEEWANVNNTIENVPVARNYRTNIVGNLLTSKTEYEVVVDANFNEPAYVVAEGWRQTGNYTYSIYNDASVDALAEVLAHADAEATAAATKAAGPVVTINLEGNVEWKTGAGHGSSPLLSAESLISKVVINGNGKTFTATGAGVGSIRLANDGLLEFNEVNVVDNSVSYNENSWEFTYLEFAGNLAFNDCTFNSGVQFQTEGEETVLNASFTGCHFISNEDSVYAAWVCDGTTTFNACTFEGTRGLKAHEQYGSEVVSVIVDGCEFGPLSKKPGIALGTLNEETAITIKNSMFIGCQAGEQNLYMYETDTDVTTFTFVLENNEVHTDKNAMLKDWIENAQAGETVNVPAGEYTFPTAAFKEGVVVSCEEGTVFTGNTKLSINGATVIGAKFSNPTGSAVDQTIDGTFKNCVFEGANAVRYAYAGETCVFENCVFSGDTYGFHFDGGANDAYFKGCTFSGFNAFGSEVELVTFDGCTFQSNGKSGYNGANLWGSAKMIDTEFIFDGTATYEWIDCIGVDKTYEFAGCTINGGSAVNPDYIYSRNVGTKITFDGVTYTWAEGNYLVAENGAAVVTNAAALTDALANGEEVLIVSDIAVAKNEAGSNGYGATGISQLNGGVIDGNGNDISVDAWGTWDSAINTTGGTIKNLNVTGGMRGIFVNHNSTHSDKVILENVTIDGTIYTISCDQGTNKGLEAYNSTFNGWTSYATTIGSVKFDDCLFGEGQGYAYCRPYAATEFVNCDFAAGYELDAVAAVTFENCTIGGVALTAENLSTLVTSNIANATVK